MKYEVGKERFYNDEFISLGYKDAILWEVLDIKEYQELNFRFISTNSKYLQGVRFAIDYGDGELEINGMKGKGFYLWENTCPEVVRIKCKSSKGKLSIYNAFDLGPRDACGAGGIATQVPSQAMLSEKSGNKIIYRCNDAGFKTDFNNLVSFTKEDYSYILNIMDDSEFFDKKNLVPIGEDPFGNLFCYDFSNKIEPDIIFWNHEENKNIHVCDTISELLAMLYN